MADLIELLTTGIYATGNGGGGAYVAARDRARELLAAHDEQVRAEATLPTPSDGCQCIGHIQDAGGGYSEYLLEYQPECPEHSTHVWDPRQGAWEFREDIRAEDKQGERKRLKTKAAAANAEVERLRSEVKKLRARNESLENSLEARDRHIDVENARAEGAREAAERIAADRSKTFRGRHRASLTSQELAIEAALCRAEWLALGEAGA